MENFKEGVINIDIKYTNLEHYIKNEILTQQIISNFNSSINIFFSRIYKNKENITTNQKIFVCFLSKYLYSRNINYLLKQKNKKYSKKISKQLNFFNLYTLFYLYIEHENLTNKLKELQLPSKIFSLEVLFNIIIALYRSEFLSFHQISNIFNYNLSLFKQSKKNFSISHKVNLLMSFIKLFWKIFKEMDDKKQEKEINNLIHKDVLSKFFEIINNIQNENNNLHIMHSLRKEINIFLFVRMIVENKCLSEENKALIEKNIIIFLKNNFRKEHLNYFYKITNKILIEFNNLNLKTIKNTKDKDDYLSLNNRFLFLTKIIEILKNVAKDEKKQITDKSCYYCDKGFVFNNEDKDRIGFKVKDIYYNNNKKNYLCILFSFLLKPNKKANNNQIIFSIKDSSNKELFCLFLNKKEFNLSYISKKINEIKILDNIEYNYYYSFYFIYNRHKIKIFINNKKVISQKDQDFKIPNKFQVLVGYPEDNQNEENVSSFNGIIFPILLFELNGKKKICSEINEWLIKLKNYYYLIAEKYFDKNVEEKNIKNKIQEKIVINYENYYGLYDELESEEYSEFILNNINNMLLYINPYVVISSFNKKTKIYKDYNYYENPDNSTKNQYSYEFNIIPSLDNGLIFPFKDNNIISFFKINNGLNFIILEIELLYNYILLLNNNSNFMVLVNENNKALFSLM